MKRWLAAAFILIVMCLVAIYVLSKPASAGAQVCAPYKPLLDQLEKRFDEAVVFTGDISGRQVIVTMSTAGSFSVLLADGNVACIILVGEKAEIDKGI